MQDPTSPTPPLRRDPRLLDPDAWRSNRHGLPPGMSPAERIAARVRHRVRASERRILGERVAAVSSLAEEIEALKAKAASEHPLDRLADAVEGFERQIERAKAGQPPNPPFMSDATRDAILKLAT